MLNLTDNAIVRRLLSGVGALTLTGGDRGRLSILMYHQVLRDPDPMRPGALLARDFDWQMKLLSEELTPLGLSEAVSLLERGRLPSKAVCVTFDDGYADNYDVAFPILRRHGVPATFFVASGYLDGGRMWNDTIVEGVSRLPLGVTELCALPGYAVSIDEQSNRAEVAMALVYAARYQNAGIRAEIGLELLEHADSAPPDNLMMTSDNVRSLHRAGMEIGAHTVTHPILSLLQEEQARWEIRAGREALQERIEGPVELFAYPNGRYGKDYLDEHATMVKDEGFAAAVSTDPGVSTRKSSRWMLKRFTPWDGEPSRFYLRLSMNALSLRGL